MGIWYILDPLLLLRLDHLRSAFAVVGYRGSSRRVLLNLLPIEVLLASARVPLAGA